MTVDDSDVKKKLAFELVRLNDFFEHIWSDGYNDWMEERLVQDEVFICFRTRLLNALNGTFEIVEGSYSDVEQIDKFMMITSEREMDEWMLDFTSDGFFRGADEEV